MKKKTKQQPKKNWEVSCELVGGFGVITCCKAATVGEAKEQVKTKFGTTLKRITKVREAKKPQ